MAKTKKTKPPEIIEEKVEAQESVLPEAITVTDEQFGKIEELVANPPEPSEALKEDMAEYKEDMAALEKGFNEILDLPKDSVIDNNALMIGKVVLNALEDADIRDVSELHFKSKGLRFRGSSLRQTQLNALLKDPTFVGKLGRLRKYL